MPVPATRERRCARTHGIVEHSSKSTALAVSDYRDDDDLEQLHLRIVAPPISRLKAVAPPYPQR